MLVELMLGAILWSTPDITDPNVELKVNCSAVEIDVKRLYRATPIQVKFYVYDEYFKKMWSYRVPMHQAPNGNIKLEPAEYWVEEVKRNNTLILQIENQQYAFDLKGSYEALKECSET